MKRILLMALLVGCSNPKEKIVEEIKKADHELKDAYKAEYEYREKPDYDPKVAGDLHYNSLVIHSRMDSLERELKKY